MKPKLNADMNVLNRRLDGVLADSGATVDNAASELNSTFDELHAKAKAGVGDPAEAEVINAVRERVLPKVTDEPMNVTDINN